MNALIPNLRQLYIIFSFQAYLCLLSPTSKLCHVDDDTSISSKILFISELFSFKAQEPHFSLLTSLCPGDHMGENLKLLSFTLLTKSKSTHHTSILKILF